MPVSEGFREYVLEQLGRVAEVTSKRMFGGVGIYSRGLFCALIDDDTLYFKVDDSNRGDYERRGMGPFRPFGDDRMTMQYYEVPVEILEDSEELGGWLGKAIAAAERKRLATGKGRGSRSRARR